MQKWEYKVVGYDVVNAMTGQRSGMVGHQAVYEGGSLEAILNELGEQGWELVETIAGKTMTFKRHKGQGDK